VKISIFFALSLFILSGISEGNASLNGSSASPVFVRMKGVPNLYRVSSGLFRSAQPTAEGMRNLKDLGVKTVINLCPGNDPTEIAALGLVYEHIPMRVWNPREKQLIRFLRILMDSKETPVLVHCQHGADRTGALCAAYRIAVEGWTKEEALQEMIDGGFGFHPIWTYLLEHWINGLNAEKIRREAGVQRQQNLVVRTDRQYVLTPRNSPAR
jgi:protein tyrosine phosphatase (PTP) superfamily phosphohydrolase (DUF442 family)